MEGNNRIEVAAALIRRADGRFMICQRPPQKARGGQWEFPGGKLEAGETPQTALVRECREELSIEIEAGDVYQVVEYAYPDIAIRLTVLNARIRAGEPVRNEHSALSWITAAEISSYDFCPADRGVTAKIAADPNFSV